MNRKQLILIFLALAVLGGAGLVLIHRHSASWSAPQGKMGRKLFPGFPLNDVAAIHVKNAAELHLANKDGAWRVQERGDYPANFSQIRDLLIKLTDLKISQSEPIGSSQLGRMDLEPPGKGTNSGTLVEFLDKQGKTLQSILLGKQHVEESSRPSPFGGGEYPDGRYLLLAGDNSELVLVSDPLSSIEINPESWLDRDFFKIDKLQSVSLVSTNASNSWKLTRLTENDPWVLADTNAGETLDSNKVASLAGAVGYPRFVDVASNTAPAATGLDKALVVNLATFDHFTYELKIGGKTPENNYYLTVAAAASLPAQRAAGPDEKPEDKQKLDKEFQDKTKELQDKLAREKSLGAWVYVVDSSLVDPLIRDRSQLLVDKKEENPAAKTGAEPPAEPKPAAVEMPGLLDAPPAANAAPAVTNVAPAVTNAPPAAPPK
ncbi:MAG: DUF4340 domain-containing protein [Verrucomicrobiota bacterium]|jgi:hypothetical protein